VIFRWILVSKIAVTSEKSESSYSVHIMSFELLLLFHAFEGYRTGLLTIPTELSRLLCRIEDSKCLRSLKSWDRGFKIHSWHGCLCLFILFVLSCVWIQAFETDRLPVHVVLPAVYRLKKLKGWLRFNKRAEGSLTKNRVFMA
jgi:hypothetical protein